MSKVDPNDFSIAKVDKKNFKHSIIERSNLTNQFTIGEVEDDMFKLNSLERELTAQIGVSTAVVGNIERNHKFVSKMSDEQLRTAAYLYETKQVLNSAKSKLKEVKNAKKKYKDVLAAVYDKFGFSDEPKE